MLNKKAYSEPNFELFAVEKTDVLALSSNPLVGDENWAQDVTGGKYGL